MKPIHNDSSNDWIGRENKPFSSQKMTKCTNKVIGWSKWAKPSSRSKYKTWEPYQGEENGQRLKK